MLNTILIVAYSYLSILAMSLGIFALTIRFAREQSSVNPYELVNLKDSSGNERHIPSALASSFVSIALMVGGLVTIYLLSRILGDFIAVFFWLITLLEIGILLFSIKPVNSKSQLIINSLLTFILGSLWLAFPSWLTYDLTFAVVLYWLIATIGGVKLRTFLIGFSFFVLYDIWGVLISGLIVKVAMEISIRPPLMLMVPTNPFVLDMNYFIALGSGDVLMGGISILTAKRYGLEKYVVVGYAIGLLMIIIISLFVDRPLPAFVTLVPCILVSFLVGYFTKHRKSLSTGNG